MIKARDAIAEARRHIGTPYGTRPGELDCINLIKLVIRAAPGGVALYTTAGTNSLWDSYNSSAKYRDLTWRQEGISGAKAGMIAFKINGDDVHHAGIVTDAGTVIHASSALGETAETKLDDTWDALAIHRHIETAQEEETVMYTAEVNLNNPRSSLNLRNGPGTEHRVIGSVPGGAAVEVIAEGDGWVYIRYDGKTGYVASEYLVRTGEDVEMPSEPEPEPGAVTIIDEAGNEWRPVGSFRVLLGSID